MPYYGRPPDYEFVSCQIVPNERSSNRFIGDTIPPTPLNPDPVTVLAAITMTSTPTGDIVAWLMGQGVPSTYLNRVEGVKITSVFEGNSAILLFKCPITTWLLLPRELGCTFIGLVRSDNLLPEASVIPRKSTPVQIADDTSEASLISRENISPENIFLVPSSPQYDVPDLTVSVGVFDSMDSFDSAPTQYTDAMTRTSVHLDDEHEHAGTFPESRQAWKTVYRRRRRAPKTGVSEFIPERPRTNPRSRSH
jgi:hypothetical protein